MAVELVLGGRLTWYAETDRRAAAVCAHHWPAVPNLGDIRAAAHPHRRHLRIEQVPLGRSGAPAEPGQHRRATPAHLDRRGAAPAT
ncbi:hypothetical protein [Micromonospora aurantiaca (nom. illeg.)]|uniref:hypothetical protein n=1 Tax=Micromonospora aurantiaca (nom. illeg.) TaxID=47850 RepID=UPI0034022B21